MKKSRSFEPDLTDRLSKIASFDPSEIVQHRLQAQEDNDGADNIMKSDFFKEPEEWMSYRDTFKTFKVVEEEKDSQNQSKEICKFKY